jgi:hypothetical protein
VQRHSGIAHSSKPPSASRSPGCHDDGLYLNAESGTSFKVRLVLPSDSSALSKYIYLTQLCNLGLEPMVMAREVYATDEFVTAGFLLKLLLHIRLFFY